MEYSRRQLDRMQLARPTVYRGHALPSLRDACQKRRLCTDGDDNDLRTRLKRFKARQADMAPLQCPICSDFCCVDEIVLVCSNDHHVCFECALGLARQGAHRHRCPMRCSDFKLREPNHLLRRLAQPLVRDVVPSGTHAMYRQLVGCGIIPHDLSIEVLRFVGVVTQHPPLRALAQRACSAWRAHVEATEELNAAAARHAPRHVRFPSSSEEEDEGETSDSDTDVVLQEPPGGPAHNEGEAQGGEEADTRGAAPE